MSRSGRVEGDDYEWDDNWSYTIWHGQVASAVRGKRGQAFLRDLIAALDALPQKRLIADALVANGEVCAIGTVYTVALIANRLGGRIDLDRIWNAQAVSGELKLLIRTWAEEVNRVLLTSANGRMV